MYVQLYFGGSGYKDTVLTSGITFFMTWLITILKLISFYKYNSCYPLGAFSPYSQACDTSLPELNRR